MLLKIYNSSATLRQAQGDSSIPVMLSLSKHIQRCSLETNFRQTLKNGKINKGYLILFTTVFLLAAIRFSAAQIPFSPDPEKSQTRSGNNQYEKQNFTEAEASYKKALDVKNNMPEATFNLGDAVYEQKRYEDAGQQFQLSAQTNPDPNVKAKAFHNLGNSYSQQKKWEDAVKSYKNALRLNPADAETKYNLAYANAMLEKEKNGGGQNNQDKKDQNKQDQNKQDQQNQNQNKDQENKDQKKDQQQQNQDQKQGDKQEQKQQPSQQQSRLSKEEAEQLLQALMNEEQKTNQKVQQQQMKGVKVKIKKDW